MKARYQIENTFKMTGRGIILAGIVLEGTVVIGDRMQLVLESETLERTITGMHWPRANAGLSVLISCETEEEINDLRERIPHGLITNIYPAL